MKTISKIIVGMMFLFTAFAVNAQAEEKSLVDTWTVLVEGTPSGDATIIISLEEKDGKVVGIVKQEGKPDTQATRVELKEDEVTVYWVSGGYDVYCYLEKVEEDKLEGSLMDMFDAYATRGVKEE